VRRAEADVPRQVQFQTKPEIALGQIRQAVEDQVAPGVVLADEVYGSSREFRDGVAELKLDYSLAVRSTTTVWALERQPLPPRPWSGKGRRPQRMQRDPTHPPLSVAQLARELPNKAWREVAWREGSKEMLRSRFAALRVRPASDRNGLQSEQ
jgi:SRSO17 transposase